MNVTLRLLRSELRLLLREPLVLAFVFAFPVVTVLILGGVFDDDDPVLARVRRIALAFPEEAEKVSHGRPAFYTRKIFAYYGGSQKVHGEWVQHPTSVMLLADLDGPEVGQQVVLTGDEGRHAAAVRRLRVGEVILISDGNGTAVRGPVATADKSGLSITVEEVLRSPASPVRSSSSTASTSRTRSPAPRRPASGGRPPSSRAPSA